MPTPASTAPFEALVVGTSAGGVVQLCNLLPAIGASFPAPVIVCQHAATGTTLELARLLATRTRMPVTEAEDKEMPLPGRCYIAPGGYHLLMERDRTFSLSMDPPVRHARPSIDVLFESAAIAYGNALVAVVLTGASGDGSDGVKAVREYGGHVVVQDPETAQSAEMPRAAIRAVEPDAVVKPEDLPELLLRLFGVSSGLDCR